MPARKTTTTKTTATSKSKTPSKTTKTTKSAKKASSTPATDKPVENAQVETPVAVEHAQVETPVAVEHAQVETEDSTVSTTSTSSTSSTSSSVGGDGEQLEADYQSLMDRLSDFKTLYTGITSDLRKLQKNMNRYIRDANKRSRRPKNNDPHRVKRQPSGFAKPALISDDLCSFLGVESGTEMARTEVTKHLTTYIKEHNLQDQENKRKILPDSALQKLLKTTSTDEVTYFNLQKFMKIHFPKSVAAAAAAALAAATEVSAPTSA